MKKSVLLSAAVLGSFFVQAQVKIGANPGTINGSSALEIEATNKGVLIPRVTLISVTSTSFMAAAPVEGTLVFNNAGSLDHGFYYWDGAKWELLTKSSTIINNTGTGPFSYYNSGTGVVMSAPGNVNVASGNSGLATGYGNQATGQYSTAMGQSNTVSGNTAFAVGIYNNVSAQYASAHGQSNTVSGNTAFASGYNNNVGTQYSAAFGEGNTVSGITAFASGLTNTVSTQYSAAFGQSNTVSGITSFASGYSNTASGSYSVAFGQTNQATASSTLAVGYNNTASGQYAAAIGGTNTASGQAAIALGFNNTASGLNSIALGAGANTAGLANSVVLADGAATSASAAYQLTGHFINGYRFQANNGTGVEIENLGHMRPSTDGQQNLGASNMRWNTIYAQNGVIQTSDVRFKDHIRPLPYGLATIMQLHPIAYSWKGGGEPKIGFSAQEVRSIIPEVVQTGNDAQQTLGINYAEMVSVLVKAVQEQQAQIDALKAENARILQALKEKR